ncbi:hypothetical protein [Spirosoma arcticum]
MIWAKADVGPYQNLRGYISQSEGVNAQMFYDPVSKAGAIVLVNQDFTKPEDAESLLGVITNLLNVAQNAP